MPREIPNGAVEIQTGLWLHTYNMTIGGTEYTFKDLYSSEGYCFYNHTLIEIERSYMQYASLGLADSENNYTSIPISELPEGEEIVGIIQQPEIV